MASTSVTKSRGKVLRLTLEMDIDGLLQFIKNDKDWRLKLLRVLGRLSRKKFQKALLSQKGREDRLYYKGFARTKNNRYKVTNTVGKNVDQIVFTSFPLNLFENGRVYKGVGVDKSPFARKKHVREPARKILTVTFKGILENHLQRYSDFAVRDVLNKEVEKI